MVIEQALKRLDNYIKSKELIKSEDKLILGCSGGADSNAMLFLLARLRRVLNVSLLAVHVNHQLRGAESDADEMAVKQLCLFLNVPIIIRKATISPTGNLENQARKARFAMFNQVLENYQFDKILLAHHSDDQAETVLQNLFRGAGICGMAGIKPIAGKIVHPMLCFSRIELEKVLIEAKIPWQTDNSNLDNSFNRNRMRNDLIPKLISEYNPGVKQHLNRLADIFLQADNLLLERTKKQLKRLTLDAAQGKISLDLAGMQKLIPIERYYLMRLIFRKLCGHEVDFMGVHYDAVEEVLFSQGSKKLALPHGVSVKKLYEELIFFTGNDALPGAESEFIEIEADRARAVYGDYRFSFRYLKVLPKEPNPEEAFYNIIIDADKIKYPFKIRFRKPGDRFIPFGMNQFKRLKEFFIDEKVPKYDRDSLPLFDDGEILFWIVGYRIDNRVRRDETSTHYLQITAEPITTKPNRAAKKKKSDKRGNDESDEL